MSTCPIQPLLSFSTTYRTLGCENEAIVGGIDEWATYLHSCVSMYLYQFLSLIECNNYTINTKE